MKNTQVDVKRINKAEIVQVIRTSALRGTGEDNDPYREVLQYWTLEGDLIADIDITNPIYESLARRQKRAQHL